MFLGEKENKSIGMYAKRERRSRGAYQSYVNVVYGLASAAGAALGGLMADTLGWRWEFGVQVPAILACLAAAIVFIPSDIGVQGEKETFMQAMGLFDFKGSILLTMSTTFLILGLVSQPLYPLI